MSFRASKISNNFELKHDFYHVFEIKTPDRSQGQKSYDKKTN